MSNSPKPMRKWTRRSFTKTHIVHDPEVLSVMNQRPLTHKLCNMNHFRSPERESQDRLWLPQRLLIFNSRQLAQRRLPVHGPSSHHSLSKRLQCPHCQSLRISFQSRFSRFDNISHVMISFSNPAWRHFTMTRMRTYLIFGDRPNLLISCCIPAMVHLTK